MKSKKKVLGLVLCAVLLVVGSVMGTMAWLTSKAAPVKNTFSTGNVEITLDETAVDEYGDAIEGANPVTGNDYKLIPGHYYVKDPTVHVAIGSEECWLFVKVVNDIAPIEAAGNTTIAAQMEANGWVPVPGETGVYALETKVDAREAAEDVDVFGSFTLAEDAVLVDAEGNDIYGADADISIQAYAVQADGFPTWEAAWAEAPTTWDF